MFKSNNFKNVGLNTLERKYGRININSPDRIKSIILVFEPLSGEDLILYNFQIDQF